MANASKSVSLAGAKSSVNVRPVSRDCAVNKMSMTVAAVKVVSTLPSSGFIALKAGQRPCDHRCVNLNGFHRCMCEPGYELDDDERSCKRVKSLCDLKEKRVSKKRPRKKAFLLRLAWERLEMLAKRNKQREMYFGFETLYVLISTLVG